MKLLLTIIAAIMSLSFIATPVYAAKDPLCNDPAFAGKNTDYCAGQGEDETLLVGGESLMANIVGLVTAIVAVASVIVIIIAGIQLTTSGGDPQRISRARSAIIYAIVGLVVAMMARIIVLYVLDLLS